VAVTDATATTQATDGDEHATKRWRSIRVWEVWSCAGLWEAVHVPSGDGAFRDLLRRADEAFGAV